MKNPKKSEAIPQYIYIYIKHTYLDSFLKVCWFPFIIKLNGLFLT